ncbi:hypothetical protein CCACVL1_21137 [Corchorus capsularis]|uniref:PGG domain-containing protein n=1 Tax=Corchorus capsularis TaxID=210143 RepID=A0A1R3H836_COCAP|nr:hypothetical protein CCACVL1_21137 [Corchorus capsularis]
MRLQHHQVEEIMDTSITYMDRKLFKAAKDGDMELLFNKYKGGLDQLVDGEQNTALHIYSTGGGREVTIIRILRRFCLSTRFEIRREVSMEYLKQLLDRCPRLLRQANAKGEIPLHVAARHGRRKIVEFLIKRSKEENVELEQMVRMTDNDQNTALHMAVQFDDNFQVVRLLLKEEPDYLSNSVDTRGITPLYLAARRGFFCSVDEILDKNYCQPRALLGSHSRTILHAATLANSEQTVKIILKSKKHLTKQGDEDGRTPLHYAAVSGYISVAKALLQSYDGSAAAYLTDKEKGMTALHMAALQGDIAMMKCIISHCPGCTGIVDKRGWNFLHFAFLTLHHARDISRDELINYHFIRNFLYHKDVDGITPSHVSRYGPHSSSEISHPVWDEKSSQVAENKTKIEQVLQEICKIEVAGILVRDFNDIPDAATDVSYKRTDEKIRQTHLLVATLVATVTFTAAFTVPGGYKSEQGTALLCHNAAFKVFIITDSLAFFVA